ncbi:hypothetical protein GCM10009612_21290 [Streptomyces beijiangensis]
MAIPAVKSAKLIRRYPGSPGVSCRDCGWDDGAAEALTVVSAPVLAGGMGPKLAPPLSCVQCTKSP